VRIWFSGPRLLNGLVRPGISLGREDFGPPRLPSWRRHELRANLQEAAKARGETMTKARPIMRQALATGQLDSKNGDRRSLGVWFFTLPTHNITPWKSATMSACEIEYCTTT
jgi:hypothetical protein